MFKIAITAGHYRYTAGKRCKKSIDPNETREWVLNARIAEKVEALLKEYGDIEILRTDDRSGEKSVALADRTKAANNWGADFYLSIHHNAGINGGKGGGIVAFVYTAPSVESVEWQTELYNSLIAKTGLKGNRSNPLARKNLHEVRETKAPAVLLELGFMDSTVDTPMILTEDFANKCAEAITEVIVKRARLTKKEASEMYNPYRVRVSISNLYIRSGAGTNYAKNGFIKPGVYTIIEEADGKGASKWGKLKSGAGWISLDYVERI